MRRGKKYINGIVNISTTISKEQYDLAIKYDISWHHALSFGIRFLAEKERQLDNEIKGPSINDQHSKF